MVQSTRGRLKKLRERDPVARFPWHRFEVLRRGPLREDAFSSPLHTERVAARLGLALGVAFTLCFLTGLVSHFMQHQPGWLHWPTSPVWLYRVTQGLHVASGIASIPLLVAKLWTVYPKLFTWPPARSLLHGVERGSLLLLVGGSVFEVTTGLINVARFYPWGFFFTTTHYWVAWITLGALVMHIAAKATEIRRGLGTPLKRQDEPDHAPGSLSRRGFIVTVSAATGAVTLVTVGQTVTPLQDLAVLGQRHADIGPQHLPVNKSAVEAKVTRDPAYRLAVEGPRPFTMTLEDLRAMPQHTVRLPIACVEGWSASADWTGVRIRDLLDRAGIAHDAEVEVESMQQKGLYRKSSLHTPHTRDDRTLLALRLNGAELDLDHGFPCRLIAPDRPGVQQTKWVNRLAAL
ncbi:MAG TPA: molybdopterin-dependent oxidoreductase [Mycobacteriales bacterium]|jgi:DMSO/TMAO reductase YedYZ molybdopterin-dependent catalytic subunit|nr:molybdopterin-dependent oxidoreductase [Mycobacteriales bacterium]